MEHWIQSILIELYREFVKTVHIVDGIPPTTSDPLSPPPIDFSPITF